MSVSFPSTLKLRPPPTREALARLRASLGTRLPEEHYTFLATADGCEGFVSGSDDAPYLVLYSVAEILDVESVNTGFPERIPHLAVGGDGSRVILAYEATSPARCLIALDIVEWDSDGMNWRCTSLAELVERLVTKGWFSDE